VTHDETQLGRLLEALADIETAARGNVERSRQLERRAAHLRERLLAGDDLVELVESEETPRMVELLSANLAVLETIGAEFRAAEALALRAQGLTIEAIAGMFGVTRQRISALLKQPAATRR
jgi:transcriptional regulator